MSEQKTYQFSSESVSEGHPDKICDQISDSILDVLLDKDSASRAGLETLCTTNYILISGEVRSECQLDDEAVKQIARDRVRKIGYEFEGFNWRDVEIDVRIHAQSSDIARGVDAGDRESEGAGDQGIMFGYASNETTELMPAPIHYSHRILESLAHARKNGEVRSLKPDSKCQVTMSYENGKPVRIDKVLVSSHHDEKLTTDEVRELVEPVILKTVPSHLLDENTEFLINPTGRFVVGGPESDTGLTGRKIIVDTYGGSALHGGGAFSGKDPTKVDRSAAYAVRYLAKNIVAAGLAQRCTIQVAYAIGMPEPVSLYLDTHGTSEVDENLISATLRELIDLRPRGIIRHLSLDKPIYSETAAYGHFGRAPTPEGGFPWEKIDLVSELERRFS